MAHIGHWVKYCRIQRQPSTNIHTNTRINGLRTLWGFDIRAFMLDSGMTLAVEVSFT